MDDSQKWIMSKTHKISGHLNKKGAEQDPSQMSDSKGGFDHDMMPESVEDSIGLHMDEQLAKNPLKHSESGGNNEIDIMDSANFN
jgi:hypothetical protein